MDLAAIPFTWLDLSYCAGVGALLVVAVVALHVGIRRAVGTPRAAEPVPVEPAPVPAEPAAAAAEA